MLKLLELIGLPVYDIETGKRLSTVKDIWLSSNWEITHLELQGSGLYSRKTSVVAWKHITACGEEAVMVQNGQVIQETSGIEAVNGRTFLQGPHRVKELPVVTIDGSQLGSIADVYFQPHMGNTIIGLEITDGLWSDLFEGRMQFEGTGRMGVDTIIVPRTIASN